MHVFSKRLSEKFLFLNMHHSLANPTNHSQPKWPLLGPALTLVSIVGLTLQKEIIIADVVKEQDCQKVTEAKIKTDLKLTV